MIERRKLFELGQVVMTPGAFIALMETGTPPSELLARHQTGDWGDLCAEDRAENRRSLAHGWRLLSSYELENGTCIWVITDADRSVTTLLLPSEY